MPDPASENSAFADIYDVWVATAPVCEANRRFFVDAMTGEAGPVVELGVGNGRITVEVARAGKAITGVDHAPGMLDLCRARAREAGVEDLVTLIRADWREFVLPAPAALITIPFHSLGHLPTLEAKAACFGQVRAQLAAGGRLLFDHFVFDPDYARARDGVPTLRAEYDDAMSGRRTLLWVTVTYDEGAQTMRILAGTESLDEAGIVAERRVRAMDFSWVHPDQVRRLLEEAGFQVLALYGDFQRGPFTEASSVQVWEARSA